MTKVLVPLADGCEEMEAVIIIDTLRRAGWEVTSAGLKPGLVTASRGVKLQPDKVWNEIDPEAFDLIVVPGGNQGVENLRADKRVLSAIKHHHAAHKLTAAVCAGPLVLQDAGVLKGRRVTSHPGAASRIVEASRVDDRVVVDGDLVTSQGPGTSFAFALALVEKVDGAEKAREIARAMVL